MVDRVNPPPHVSMPRKLSSDPELGPYFQQIGRILFQLWSRVGGGSDDQIEAIHKLLLAADSTAQVASLQRKVAELEANLARMSASPQKRDGDAHLSPLMASLRSAIAAVRNSLGSAARADIVGTVSEDGGVPTGDILESGSNANGEYIYYADGTLIVRKDVALSGVAVTSAWGSIYASGGIDLGSMAQTFSAVPTVNFFVKLSSGSCWIGKYGSTGAGVNSWGYVELYRGSSSTITSLTISCTAIGKWF